MFQKEVLIVDGAYRQMGTCPSTPEPTPTPVVSAPKKNSIYYYRLIYDFSELTEPEKEKVRTLIKERIELYSKDQFRIGKKTIFIPKYLRVSDGRYFNIAFGFVRGQFKQEDRWDVRVNSFSNRIINAESSELLSMLESEILMHNKGVNFILTTEHHRAQYPDSIKYCQQYESEEEAKTCLYGHLPAMYREWEYKYHTIEITLRKVFNSMEQS
jgi:hypothetical protein